MLCDQASDKIFFIYQTASHVPLTTSILLQDIKGPANAQRQIRPAHYS